MMKLRSNKGITLSFTVVIMFFVSLLVAALVGYISLSYQISTRQLKQSEHKIILENKLYEYINTLYGTSFNEFNNDTDFQEIAGYLFKKTKVENDIIIEIKGNGNFANIVLSCTLDCTLSEAENKIDNFEIIKWGFN